MKAKIRAKDSKDKSEEEEKEKEKRANSTSSNSLPLRRHATLSSILLPNQPADELQIDPGGRSRLRYNTCMMFFVYAIYVTTAGMINFSYHQTCRHNPLPAVMIWLDENSDLIPDEKARLRVYLANVNTSIDVLSLTGADERVATARMMLGVSPPATGAGFNSTLNSRSLKFGPAGGEEQEAGGEKEIEQEAGAVPEELLRQEERVVDREEPAAQGKQILQQETCSTSELSVRLVNFLHSLTGVGIALVQQQFLWSDTLSALNWAARA